MVPSAREDSSGKAVQNRQIRSGINSVRLLQIPPFCGIMETITGESEAK